MAYRPAPMRVRMFLFILAFLLSSPHVVVDHMGGRHRDVVLMPHAGAGAVQLHADADRQAPPGAPDPDHHDADTHTHGEWYIPAAGSGVAPHSMASVTIDHSLWVVTEPLVDSASVYRQTLARPPPRAPLYLRHCSLLS
jgi:hypothetical protein